MFMNKRWYNNFKVRAIICALNIELLCISFRPYYLQRELNQVHLFLVYITPGADADVAVRTVYMYDTVQCMEDHRQIPPRCCWVTLIFVHVVLTRHYQTSFNMLMKRHEATIFWTVLRISERCI